MKPEQVHYRHWRDSFLFFSNATCLRCGRHVSKWHEHLTKKGESLDATKKGESLDATNRATGGDLVKS